MATLLVPLPRQTSLLLKDHRSSEEFHVTLQTSVSCRVPARRARQHTIRRLVPRGAAPAARRAAQRRILQNEPGHELATQLKLGRLLAARARVAAREDSAVLTHLIESVNGLT